MNDDLYKSITEKLGTIPEKYKAIYDNTENDNMYSQMDLLSYEELLYLKEHNYFLDRA